MLRGKLWTAAGWIMEWKKVGVLHLVYTCTYTIEPVLDFIQLKNPEARAPSDHIINAYSGRPP